MRNAIITLWLLLASIAEVPSAGKYAELNPSRIREIEAMLQAQPAGFGRPCGEREFWQSPGIRDACGPAVAEAESLLDEAFPAWSDELYLDFSRTGTRPAPK